MSTSRSFASVVALSASALLLSACADGEESGAASEASGEEQGSGHGAEQSSGQEATLSVVTSTDVYADLAARILGDTAAVTPLVDDSAADPHSYEATPQDRLHVDRADVIIANGGGYDPFITGLAASSEKEDAVYQVIEGEDPHAGSDSHDDAEHDDAEHEHDEHEQDDHGEEIANEHIWYDLAAMRDFVEDFGEHMAELAPEHSEMYRSSAADLAEELQSLDERNRAIQGEGLSFMSTEPVSALLLGDAGLEDRTDAQFLAAVEHGDDVAPRLYQDALSLASEGDIDLLAHNPQTETRQSAQIRSAAEDSGVTVLEFRESIPEEQGSYTAWMEHNVSAVESAVEELHD